MLARRYLLQLRALELFMGGGAGGSSVFLSFDGAEQRLNAQRAILAMPLPGLLPHHPRKPEEVSAISRPHQHRRDLCVFALQRVLLSAVSSSDTARVRFVLSAVRTGGRVAAS